MIPRWLRMMLWTGRAIRYLVIFCSVGWGAAAAAFEMWGAVVIFLTYAGAVYWLGTIVDRELEPWLDEVRRHYGGS